MGNIVGFCKRIKPQLIFESRNEDRNRERVEPRVQQDQVIRQGAKSFLVSPAICCICEITADLIVVLSAMNTDRVASWRSEAPHCILLCVCCLYLFTGSFRGCCV